MERTKRTKRKSDRSHRSIQLWVRDAYNAAGRNYSPRPSSSSFFLLIPFGLLLLLFHKVIFLSSSTAISAPHIPILHVLFGFHCDLFEIEMDFCFVFVFLLFWEKYSKVKCFCVDLLLETVSCHSPVKTLSTWRPTDWLYIYIEWQYYIIQMHRNGVMGARGGGAVVLRSALARFM